MGVSLSGDVPGPRLRNAPSRAGSPGPRRRWYQPLAPRASVSATVQWGGPPAPRREGRMPRRPAPACGAASRGPAPTPSGGRAGRAGARESQPWAAVSTVTGKMASGAGPRRPRGAPSRRAPAKGRRQALSWAAGKSGTGTARPAGAAAAPHLPSPCTGAPRGRARPRFANRSGPRARRCTGRGRVPSGGREGSRRQPRARPKQARGGGGGVGSGLRTLSQRAPASWARNRFVNLNRYCNFRWNEPPRGAGRCCCCCRCNIFPQHLLRPGP